MAAFARSPGPARGRSVRAHLERGLQDLWFGPRGLLGRAVVIALLPLSALVARVAARRRQHIARAKAEPRVAGEVPVIVVGNLTVGGTGKTPLLIALADALSQRGWRVGLIARGHGARLGATIPRVVPPDGSAADYGDEPVLVAARTGLPVVIGHDRGAALRQLIANFDCNLVLSDDGLQHVGLARRLELAVFDARGAGNGHCLPAGPLREPLRGALLMDGIVLNGLRASAPMPHSRTFRFELQPCAFVSLDRSRQWTPHDFVSQVRDAPLDALAGIGSPQRFFDTLESLGIRARQWPLADHAPIDEAWLAGLTGRWLIMTEKDAVKCTGFDARVLTRCVFLRVDALAETALIDWLEERLHG